MTHFSVEDKNFQHPHNETTIRARGQIGEYIISSLEREILSLERCSFCGDKKYSMRAAGETHRERERERESAVEQSLASLEQLNVCA
jgi:hypothetical protein